MTIYVVMGGSFSPPTMAHFQALQAAVQQVGDMYPTQHVKGLFVPVSKNYDKASVKVVSEEDRVAMLEIGTKWLNAYSPSPNLEYAVSTHEIEKGRHVPTHESIDILKEADPKGIYYLALGQDNLVSLLAGKWKESQKLVDSVRILYFVRPDTANGGAAAAVTNFPKNVTPAFPIRKIDFDATSISSTRLRAALKGAEDPKYLTLPGVLEYIRDHKLYGTAGGRRKTRRRRDTKRRRTNKHRK